MFSGRKPQAVAASVRAVTATNWAATASDWLVRSNSQLRAVAALVRVSKVVKDLETTMNSVVSGSASANASAMAWPSMLATKWKVSGQSALRSASVTSSGPSWEPPMPMWMTR